MIYLIKSKCKVPIFFRVLPLFVSTTIAGFITSCGYTPQQYIQIDPGKDPKPTAGISVGTVYKINAGAARQQICNSSISQDTVNFRGAMLWLGFNVLEVNNPPQDYDLKNVEVHDRLTISNYKNEVVWFLMKDSVPGIDCEFQDPEWAAHPDYLSTLGQYKNDGYCDGHGDYSSYAIRTHDKAVLMLNQRKFNNSATPHIWVDHSVKGTDGGTPDTVDYDTDGFADVQSIKEFFGTQNIRIAWSEKEDGLTIHWADYSSGTIVTRKLDKPEGRVGWKAESPLFSPDGRFITFNLYQNQIVYEAWVQELSEGATPIKISDDGMDPRWWRNPYDDHLYVTYVKRNGEIYTIVDELSDPKLATSGDAGGTYMKQFYAPLNVPKALREIGQEKLLVNLPFKGGFSPDGKFMCTGTNYAYMLELE